MTYNSLFVEHDFINGMKNLWKFYVDIISLSIEYCMLKNSNTFTPSVNN